MGIAALSVRLQFAGASPVRYYRRCWGARSVACEISNACLIASASAPPTPVFKFVETKKGQTTSASQDNPSPRLSLLLMSAEPPFTQPFLFFFQCHRDRDKPLCQQPQKTAYHTGTAGGGLTVTVRRLLPWQLR